jgi:hypothetical protein
VSDGVGGRAGRLVLASSLAVACAPALRPPPPVPRLGPEILAPGARPSAAADAVLAQADALFRGRARVEDVRAAQRLFLEAARGDVARVEGLLGVARSTAWLVEHEPDPDARRALVTVGVQSGQLCKERAPESAACDYALAIALGQQARERPATGHDGVSKMVAALQRAIGADPRLDHAGPHRVLALVYLRAPGWPAGPGDPEAGLRQAQAASALAPDHPANQLALGEALRRNDRRDEARRAFARALHLARARMTAGDPDAAEWVDEAQRGLGPV